MIKQQCRDVLEHDARLWEIWNDSYRVGDVLALLVVHSNDAAPATEEVCWSNSAAGTSDLAGSATRTGKHRTTS